MSMRDDIEQRLKAAFSPAEISVSDDSDQHIGHAGHDGRGESHFSVKIRAAAFAGQSRVQQHRSVHKALGDIVPRIHALALDIGA
ncbi:BolA protein [Epibacterium ulvae]|uniref:BolA protein n=1 Tax=Epibacterium ulvae TaxID=1156985 RepID=A0A1G5QQN1_9RHOB|nr:BolA family protein [Epibacterium ulvae]SCZ63840.1 BolA protein [Epibacterium ulvae]